ncbi:unnamed protein product [Colias eurytheme]|nr:unnamed protein product [Colias eurytheme]
MVFSVCFCNYTTWLLIWIPIVLLTLFDLSFDPLDPDLHCDLAAVDGDTMSLSLDKICCVPACGKTHINLIGGGDSQPTPGTSQHINGSKEDVDAICKNVKIYKSLECFDMKIPGLRFEQIEQLTMLKNLFLRKLKFYFDEDSFLFLNWNVAARRTNQVIFDKIGALRNKEKVTIVTLTIETDWLRAALEYIKDLKTSVTTETESTGSLAPGPDLRGIYALDDLSGSGPQLVKNIILSVFSNEPTERARSKLEFRTWMYAIGGDILAMNNHDVFNKRRVCHIHFENRYQTWSKRLSASAVPTLNLPGFIIQRRPLQNVTNIIQSTTHKAQETVPAEVPSTSASEEEAIVSPPPEPFTSKGPRNRQSKPAKAKMYSSEIAGLTKEITKLRDTRDKYALKLKKALKLSENETFQKAVKKFTYLAMLFVTMQFRETKKNKMGRRFTKEEKIMALSLYKQGPKAYRWLRKIFVLPAPVTLSRMITTASLKPGINNNLFEQLGKRVKKMNANEKLCILLFDEVALAPNFNYNQRKDKIIGFVDNGLETQKKIGDHALVFMIRGLFKNYKQPIAYSFCSGSTQKEELARQITEITRKLKSIGLNVMATVCDQGASNMSAINYLIKITKENYLRKGEEHKKNTFEIDKQEIVPLYDCPHLIKGIRNNLVTKDLQFVMNGTRKLAKWDHIISYEEEIKLMRKAKTNTKKALSKLEPGVQKEPHVEKRLKQPLRSLLPDAPPRKRQSKQQVDAAKASNQELRVEDHELARQDSCPTPHSTTSTAESSVVGELAVDFTTGLLSSYTEKTEADLKMWFDSVDSEEDEVDVANDEPINILPHQMTTANDFDEITAGLHTRLINDDQSNLDLTEMIPTDFLIF